MSIETERLKSLIEFAQQAARMRTRPPTSVGDHGIFSLYEHQLRGLPGVHLNVAGADGADELWLVVERLHETSPPAVSDLLAPWISLSGSPTDEPALHRVVTGPALVTAGGHAGVAVAQQHGTPATDAGAPHSLDDSPDLDEIQAQFEIYSTGPWRTWAESEIPRRRTIRLYSQLFTLKQELEGGIVEAQLELVWGVGVGVWATEGVSVNYPLVAQLVELGLDAASSNIVVRPRSLDAQLQLDWYASVDNTGVTAVEKTAANFMNSAPPALSPFDHASFEPILRAASAHLDANGQYWPDVVAPEDREVPNADGGLKVTDSWVLFARTRSNSVFIQDLEKLKKASDATTALPPAVNAIVADPPATSQPVTLPLFRGVSAMFDAESAADAPPRRDLYFPKPFNNEQVRIVQLLETSDGVVVQGPPGTGKTHTIANVICHYLAEGKRVLVTSMKDAALGVLQEQLPAEIRPLAISLLASEQDGMKQFEHAIQRIASEIQSLDRAGTAAQISHLNEAIDESHRKLAVVDRRVSDWATRNLSKVCIDGEELDPQDVARELVAATGEYEWIADPLSVSDECRPNFSDQDIIELRAARRSLGADIDYLGASLPQVADFPAARDLLTLHQDLARLAEIGDAVDRGDVPALADSTAATLSAAESLLARVQALRALGAEIAQAEAPWAAAMRARLREDARADAFQLLDQLCADLARAREARKLYLSRPVTLPEKLETDIELRDAIGNLAAGRSPFGMKGLFGKSEQKALLAAVRELGDKPRNAGAWKHVAGYVALRSKFIEFAARWNALGRELGVDVQVPETADGGLAAALVALVYQKLRDAVASEREIAAAAATILPDWSGARDIAKDTLQLAILERFLRQHVMRARLARVWARKDQLVKALDGRSGRVVSAIRAYVDGTLGDRAVDDSAMQAQWSALMTELSRVSALSASLATVQRVTAAIEASGAPRYAQLLREPVAGAVDGLLPDSWRKSWRLRRLATHLESIDAQHHLPKLASERRTIEKHLAKAYREIVARKTWLKLAENASPTIRAALQAYLNAIQKIGKGTGKRAARFRSDARAAAALANPAVPCWIMAHYRVSESLPAELGCFDLVVIDEASQSDLSALPALLRAQKVLIVGDDKQVSPEGVGFDEDKVRHLMARFLGSQVATYRAQLSPERSIYDLYRVVFAESGVMLKEHFRCVGPIIEYSKREHYGHELRPLRLPKASERLDPPLIDVFVRDGFRDGDTNLPEARFIVNEIRAITSDPKLATRSIGVVSLLADKQALLIWEMLATELGPDLIERHRIACGDARTFQGKERDIMFLTMIIAPNVRSGVSSRETFAQRYNVAASRARDRMYLVRSVEMSDLSAADQLRRALLTHFAAPFAQNAELVGDMRSRCESPLEREVYDELTQRGYWVTPQVKVGRYRIDMVVEGRNDARLAVECDGDRYLGADKWAEDMRREQVLRRAGWSFWRCFASAFILRRSEVVADLLKTLSEKGIEPIGSEGAPRSVHVERRDVTSADVIVRADAIAVPEPAVIAAIREPADVAIIPEAVVSAAISEPADAPPDAPAAETEVQPPAPEPAIAAGRADGIWPAHFEHADYRGGPLPDPRSVRLDLVADGLVAIVKAEGPIGVKRAYDVYMSSCGIKRLGHELRSTMNKALLRATRDGRLQIEKETDAGGSVGAIVRTSGSPSVVVRSRGSRTFSEIPLTELRLLARLVATRAGLEEGSESHQRAVLGFYDLKRLTRQVSERMGEALGQAVVLIDD